MVNADKLNRGICCPSSSSASSDGQAGQVRADAPEVAHPDAQLYTDKPTSCTIALRPDDYPRWKMPGCPSCAGLTAADKSNGIRGMPADVVAHTDHPV
jgi:hypothetical protein